MRNLSIVACVAVLIAFAMVPLGCDTNSGSYKKQDLAGQALTREGGDAIAVLDDPKADGKGTSNVQGTPPLFVSNASADGSPVRSSALVPTQVVLEADGKKFSYFSGKNGEGRIEFAESTGAAGEKSMVPKLITFKASASEPLAVVATVAQVRADVEKALSADQREVLKTISENQKQTILGVAEKAGPIAEAFVKSLLGVP